MFFILKHHSVHGDKATDINYNASYKMQFYTDLHERRLRKSSIILIFTPKLQQVCSVKQQQF